MTKFSSSARTSAVILVASLVATACAVGDPDAVLGAGEEGNLGEYTATPEALAVVDSGPAHRTITVNVDGRRGLHNEKEIALVEKGDTIIVRDQKGQVDFQSDPETQANDCLYKVGPMGLSREDFDLNSLLCYNLICAADPVINKGGHAGLVVRLGNAYEFAGRPLKFTATRTARLYLGINDGCSADNTGRFTATVEIIKGSR